MSGTQRVPSVDPWKACVLNIELATTLTPSALYSGFGKEHFAVGIVSLPRF